MVYVKVAVFGGPLKTASASASNKSLSAGGGTSGIAELFVAQKWKAAKQPACLLS